MLAAARNVHGLDGDGGRVEVVCAYAFVAHRRLAAYVDGGVVLQAHRLRSTAHRQHFATPVHSHMKSDWLAACSASPVATVQGCHNTLLHYD